MSKNGQLLIEVLTFTATGLSGGREGFEGDHRSSAADVTSLTL